MSEMVQNVIKAAPMYTNPYRKRTNFSNKLSDYKQKIMFYLFFTKMYNINGISSYLIKTGACGRGGGAHTHHFCEVIIKGSLNKLEYTNNNF